MRRKCFLPVGRVRDLAVVDHVIVRASDNPDVVAVRIIRELLEIGNQLLGVRYVQLSVRLHEVVLGVDVPEDDARYWHGTGNLDGAKASALRPPRRTHAGE